MTVSRRRLLRSVSLAGAGGAAAQQQAQPATTLDGLRNVAAAHGIDLDDGRPRVLQPVVDRRLAQLRALRDFEIDDAIAPTQGIIE